MAKIIPNANSWIGFTTTAPAGYTAANVSAGTVTVTTAELDAATNITPFVVQMDPSQAGNMIPTPSLDSPFERQTIGTVQGNLTGTFYRDSVADTAWELMARNTSGYFLVSRFGGTGASKKPVAGQTVEVWPITFSSRKASAMTSNTVQTFDIMGALDVPVENASVSSSSGAPAAPLNVTATAGATGTAVVDWDAPSNNGGAAITGYKVFKSSSQNGTYTEVTTNITKVGTTATLTSLTAGVTWFKVAATNSNGDSGQSAAASCTVV